MKIYIFFNKWLNKYVKKTTKTHPFRNQRSGCYRRMLRFPRTQSTFTKQIWSVFGHVT